MSNWLEVTEDRPVCNVLVFYRNSQGKGRIVKALWVSKLEVPDDDDDCLDFDTDDNGYQFWPEGWYEQIDNWGDFSSIFITEGEVTHWMPLPEYPDKPTCSK